MPITASNLLARMSDLSLQDVDRHAKVHIYGPSGAGKTTLAVWLAQNLINEDEGDRIVLLDSAEGWVSLDDTPSLKENVTRLPYESYGDLPALADAISKNLKGFENIRVVIVDEVDSISDDVLTTVVREKHGLPKTAQLPEIEGKDYRPMGDLMRDAIKKIEKAGVHLILVSHEKERTDHRKVTRVGSNLTPKLNGTISELMHVVAHATAEIKGTAAQPEYLRQVQCLPTSLVDAKTRVGALRKAVKISHQDFVEALAQWVAPGGGMAEDLAAPEVPDEEQPDELPTDGIPVADAGDEDDDEPIIVGSDE